MYNPLFVNILFIFIFPLDLQEKNHVAPKKEGGTLGISKKIIKNFQKIVNFFSSCGIGPSLHGSLNSFNVEL
jgi:hypothetical protein